MLVAAAAEVAGRINSFRGHEEWTAPLLEIGSGEPLVDVGIDGEARRPPAPLRFRSPINAPGGAVAPIGLGKAFTALFRVLTGHPAR